MSFLITDPYTCEEDFTLKSRVEPNQYSCLLTHTPTQNSYVFNFQAWNEIDWDSEVKSTYKIDSDYDRGSKFMICRYIIMFSKSVVVYPHLHSQHITILGDKKNSSAALSTLNEQLGLTLVLTDPGIDGECDYGDRSHAHQVLMFQIYDCLLKNGYSPFVTPDQLDGVVSKRVQHKYLHVCAIKTATMSHTGDGCLTVETSHYKINPFTLELLTQLHQEEALEQQQHSGPDFGDGSDAPLWKHFRVFVPTNEDIIVLSYAFYESPVLSGNATERQRERSFFLTASDVRNRSRGYNSYVPDSYSKVRLFWELGCGLLLPEAPGKPAVFARISFNGIEQVVPVDCIARGTAQLPNKATTHSAMVDDLYEVLRSSSLFQSISRPVPAATLSGNCTTDVDFVSHSDGPNTIPIKAKSARFKSALTLSRTTALHPSKLTRFNDSLCDETCSQLLPWDAQPQSSVLSVPSPSNLSRPLNSRKPKRAMKKSA